MKYRPKHIIEYIALRSFAWWFAILPYRGALALGWSLAWIGFHIARFRRAEARERLLTVFPDRPIRELDRIAWQSWLNLVFSTIEMLRMPDMTLDWLRRHSDFGRALRLLKRHCESGRGAILALPHMGAWEMTGMICHLDGLPIFNIAARQKNPLVADFIDHLRANTGITTVSRGAGTMRTTIRTLREGGILAILPDVRVHKGGLHLPFLGGTASLGKGMALFARHANVPILPVIVTRNGWAGHKVEMFDPVEPDPTLDKETDVERMTRTVVDRINRRIQQQPEQWFWFNKRWVLDPTGDA